MSAPVDSMRAAADQRERSDPHLVSAVAVELDVGNSVFASALRSALSAVYAANDAGSAVLSIEIHGGHPRVRILPPTRPDALPGAMRRRETREGMTEVAMVAVRHGALIEWSEVR
jgi:hypothetical protein